LEEAGFTLNRSKVYLAQSEIKFLGHTLSAQGVKVLPERVEVIQQFPTPKKSKDGMPFHWYGWILCTVREEFFTGREPLHALKRKNAKFVWGDSRQKAFDQLKVALSTPPVLQIPDFSQEFISVCDSSDVTISAVLYQKRDGNPAPIAYVSHLLSPAERKYFVYEKQCLAVVYGCEQYRAHLEHKELTLHTDKFCHIPGKASVVADCLTRQYEAMPFEEKFLGLILQHLPVAFQSENIS
jgi:hypothetical protein